MTPEPDEDFIPVKTTWDIPFHLTKTRTTFMKIHKLHMWDHLKMTLFDSNLPYTMVINVSLSLRDVDKMIDVLKQARYVLEVDLSRLAVYSSHIGTKCVGCGRKLKYIKDETDGVDGTQRLVFSCDNEHIIEYPYWIPGNDDDDFVL